MPFMDAGCPSIQLGLLTAIGRAHGFPVRSFHANLDFAARIGKDFYQKLSGSRGRLIGDWLFSVAAFRAAAPDPRGLLLAELADDLSRFGPAPEAVRERLLRIRERDVPAYLDELLDALAWEEVDVVGFSSTYQQNTASLALARRLKDRFPDLITLLGGANLEGEAGIELVRSADWIDLAVSGEADETFPRLLAALAAGTDPGAIPGVIQRVAGQVVLTPPGPPTSHLDSLPVPDYEEYFQHAVELGLLPAAKRQSVWIPLETARGCWWGVKHHCTFCGLNTTRLEFRSKSPDRVFDELAQQARRFGSFRFASVDNILDLDYLTTLYPRLIRQETDYELFYEVKANLDRADLRLLSAAGVRRLQPGIESLSSRILQLMRKGVTAAQNVNFLRWAAYYGIDVAWNILWGIPGETQRDYAEQATLVPNLVHLQPPASAARIWMERFSPLHARPECHGVRSMVPERSYHYVYPSDTDLAAIAYFFEYDLAEQLPDSTYDELRGAVADWTEARNSVPPPELTYWSAPGYLQIHDGRHNSDDGTYSFEGTPARVYVACSDHPTSAAAVARGLPEPTPVEAVEEIIAEFHRLGLMLRDGAHVLALALPAVTGR
jgi:ribosomal peptide maturation radical SAM protein 1